jgi:hypothetical protein
MSIALVTHAWLPQTNDVAPKATLLSARAVPIKNVA